MGNNDVSVTDIKNVMFLDKETGTCGMASNLVFVDLDTLSAEESFNFYEGSDADRVNIAAAHPVALP